jgi:dihydroorotate dehydrogenase
MFVKVAPDLEWSALDDVLQVATDAKLTGIVATNTTISREGLTRDPAQAGGLSGKPVQQKANAVLKYIAAHCDPDLMLIGVGGIMNANDVLTKIKLGAHLCQVYTGWIYGGPHMLPDIMSDLVGLMDRDGVKHIGDYRGTGLTR